MSQKKKKSNQSGQIRVRAGHHRVKAPWWVFLVILLVGAVAVGIYFSVYAFAPKKGDSSPTSSPSASSVSSSESASSSLVDSASSPSSIAASSAASSALNYVAPIDIYLQELGNANTGDSIYVKAGDNDILIDAGSDNTSAQTLVSFLKSKVTDSKLEYVIATHAHTDHIGAFYGSYGIFANFDCRTIIDFPKTAKTSTSTTTVYGKYVSARDAEVASGSSFGAEHYTALECYNANSTGTTGAHRYYTLGNNLSMEILYNYYYDHKQSSGENDYSVCLQFIQGNNHYLFCGDCEDLSEKTVVANNSLTHCVFYKADHHGSKTSTCPELMKAITPTYVGISCIAGNYEYSQTHFDDTFPCQRTINTLAPFTKKIMVTTQGSAADPAGSPSTHSSFNGVIHVAGRGLNESDVSMSGSVNSTTYLKDSDWFKQTGNQEGGAVDEGETTYTHSKSDPNRYWPSDGVD